MELHNVYYFIHLFTYVNIFLLDCIYQYGNIPKMTKPLLDFEHAIQPNQLIDTVARMGHAYNLSMELYLSAPADNVMNKVGLGHQEVINVIENGDQSRSLMR